MILKKINKRNTTKTVYKNTAHDSCGLFSIPVMSFASINPLKRD